MGVTVEQPHRAVFSLQNCAAELSRQCSSAGVVRMRICVLACLVLMTGSEVFASQHHEGVKANTIEEDIFKMLEDDEDYDDMKEVEEEAEVDPCESVHCTAGKECVEDEEGDSRCRQERVRHAHIEYYGECRQISECSEDDLLDFPRRMREWLFNVMKELAERDEISLHYKQLEKEAESDQSLRWSNAAVWQWCDLDKHPHDNVVSRHELFPLKAPLHTLEHCLAPFLDTCDKDTDHVLTLKEWAGCLELEEEELLDKCEEIKKKP